MQFFSIHFDRITINGWLILFQFAFQIIFTKLESMYLISMVIFFQ